jgi:hypothetical protein
VVSPRRDVWIWIGGAAIVVLGVLAWLWFDQPPENVLPDQYGFGVL